MKPVLAVIAVATIAFGALPATVSARDAEASVHSLSLVPASGKADVVIGIAGGPEVHDFTLRSPDRIVVDLTAASLSMAARGYDRVSRGGITDIRYSQFKKGTVRVVVYLDEPRSYQITRNDGEVRLTVTVPVGSQFAEWRVGSGVNAGKRIVVEQEKAAPTTVGSAGEPPRSGPVAAQARAVVDNAVPEKSAAPAREVARAAEPAYEAPMRTALSSPQRASSSQTQLPQAQQRSQQPTITVTFIDSDIRDVIASFSQFSGRTIIPGVNVPKTVVNAEIKSQPWDVALQAILAAQGLAAVEDANGILIVDTQERIAARAETEVLATRPVRLNYQKAAAVAAQIRQRLLSCTPSERSSGGTQSSSNVSNPPAAAAPPAQPTVQSSAISRTPSASPSSGADDQTCRGRGSVTADEATNSISITAPVSALDGLVEIAHTLDARQPSVNIKAKIVLVSRTDLDALGIKYDLGSRNQFFSNIIQRVDSAGKPGNPTDPPLVFLGGNTVSAIGNASGDVPGAALRLIYSTALGNFDFSTFLDALQSVNLLDVQAEPSVTTLNNKLAILTSGVQVPFVPLASSGGSGTSLTGPVTVERVQTGVTLSVLPSVTNNRQVLMHVEVTNADASFTNNGTLIDNNDIKNDMLVADGQTVVIGGLTQTTVRVTKSGIPLLVDLPVIGRLFGYTTRQEQRRDLLIMITPHITDEGQVTFEPVRR